MELDLFVERVKKVKGPRKHIISNSIGTFDIYRMIRRNGWKGIGHTITEKDFYAIVREMNKLVADNISKGIEVVLPQKCGILELRKKETKIFMLGDKLVTNLPVNWSATLLLWHEDEEARREKILVRFELPSTFKVIYDKRKANFKNKSYYYFRPMRSLKQKIALLIKDNKTDAYLINNYD